jgi:GntR family histidine utilization transcriptional repressor
VRGISTGLCPVERRNKMKKPLFKKIKDFIKEQIAQEVYSPDEKIPTEMEFAKMFNTSRQTVNKALRDLVLDGIIVRFPRSGTFVKPKIAQTSILDLKSISDEIKQRGNQYSSELIRLQEVKANQQIAEILHIVKDQKIYISQMLHKENGIPVRFDIRYINPLSAPKYIEQIFKDTTPSQYLQKYCPVEKVDNKIEAVLVDKIIEQYLEITTYEPCLLISRAVTSRGKIATYSKLYYPSSRYKLSSTFTSSD